MLEVYEFSTLRNNLGLKKESSPFEMRLGEVSEKRQFWKGYLSDIVFQLDRRETPFSKMLS